MVFSSGSSYDPDGYVNYTEFYINGVLQATSSYTASFTRCFALHGSPSNGCYQLASGVTTVTVGFKVRDNSGDWSSLVTKTYTIQEHKGRKYFVKDHLGTVRATVNRDGNVLGHDDYYPFGLTMPGRSNNTSNPNDLYKFTGHERDKEAGLDLVFAGARMMDPISGRWLSIDPLIHMTNPSEYIYHSVSPYNYVLNNPTRYVDPNGLWVITFQVTVRGMYKFLGGSLSVGLAVDDNNNVGLVRTAGVAGGVGAGYGASVELSSYGGLDTIYNLSGWGTNYGAALQVASLSAFSLEGNFTSDFFGKNDNSASGTTFSLPGWGFGNFVGAYGELAYTTVKGLGNIEEDGLKGVLNSLINDYGFSKSEAEAFLNAFESAYKEAKAKIEGFDEKFASENVQNTEQGTYTWNGEEWVKQD
ncbi:MAG: RHS repeat-associated core domain-containing protein [Balneola sp.]|nr:MAG: RHS repeat-associated core domain-containing protein [Balneola sp.]